MQYRSIEYFRPYWDSSEWRKITGVSLVLCEIRDGCLREDIHFIENHFDRRLHLEMKIFNHYVGSKF